MEYPLPRQLVGVASEMSATPVDGGTERSSPGEGKLGPSLLSVNLALVAKLGGLNPYPASDWQLFSRRHLFSLAGSVVHG